MNDFVFFTLIALILLGYFYNEVLVDYLSELEVFINITKSNVNQILTIILIIIILIAGLDPTGTKNKYSNISQGLDNIRSPASQNRPNPMFDVDTYW